MQLISKKEWEKLLAAGLTYSAYAVQPMCTYENHVFTREGGAVVGDYCTCRFAVAISSTTYKSLTFKGYQLIRKPTTTS